MVQDNLVVFKGYADGIIVLLDEMANFEAVLECFKQKLKDSERFFKGSRVSLRFKGRPLSEKQQEILLELLANQNIVNISFVHEFENEKEMFKETDYLKWIKEQIESGEASLTHFHYGIVRSGNHVHASGNVVVLGDVNPGGLVTAGGNILIMGSLKGKVHAGMDPSFSHPFVIAQSMQPIQIGIASIIAQSPQGNKYMDIGEGGMQMAYLYEEEIYINQMDTKTLSHMLK
ncbi:hypothetical protein CS063_05405 [Sporanaerobium hydrogeniformans]|uniref:Uncharacterized protein n=1 Tax=Sporanaerobium hydrogeniformans TaxID=3072179 RepID=A0AC61DF12_9FIRM|nr:septum site-determining protein MinC [Sporanaerobium hydrogeniformans]PHV71485.1 hypothetical protein CS063_05405 [Sporanaerobium hydrogeniformans]